VRSNRRKATQAHATATTATTASPTELGSTLLMISRISHSHSKNAISSKNSSSLKDTNLCPFFYYSSSSEGTFANVKRSETRTKCAGSRTTHFYSQLAPSFFYVNSFSEQGLRRKAFFTLKRREKCQKSSFPPIIVESAQIHHIFPFFSSPTMWKKDFH